MQPSRLTNLLSLPLKSVLTLIALTASTGLLAQDEIAELAVRGGDLFFERVSCWICHGENADGLVGHRYGTDPHRWISRFSWIRTRRWR